MKQNSSALSYVLHVFPRGNRLPEDIPVELNPQKGELIKHEPVTLIWREVLANGRQAVVKLYRRGLSVWCGSRIYGFRVRREFDGLSLLEKFGIPCSVPLFWCHGRFGFHGWGEMLVTEWVAQSQSLRDLLVNRPEVSGVLGLSPLFADLARMHGAGLHHGMLRTRNVLVKNDIDKPVFVFIDMPRFHYYMRDIRGTRMASYDLMSLCEGLLPHFREDQVMSWLSAYGIPESEKMDLLIRLKGFQSTRFLRRVMGAEFNVRVTTARLFPFHARNASGRQPHERSRASGCGNVTK